MSIDFYDRGYKEGIARASKIFDDGLSHGFERCAHAIVTDLTVPKTWERMDWLQTKQIQEALQSVLPYIDEYSTEIDAYRRGFCKGAATEMITRLLEYLVNRINLDETTN